jgi:uncharacterized alpha-E superfamily protein
MLGRTASSLFWMSRYMERAENMARLLEVGYRISLMPGAIEGPPRRMAFDAAERGLRQSYSQKHDTITARRLPTS